MTGQKLVDELEKALTDEAYDGGMGAMSPEEFRDLVRTLAVTAAKVVDEMRAPTGNEKLIEAEKAITEALAIDTHYMHPEARRLLMGALAVFEKALTPTDDERRWAEYRDGDPANNTPDQRRAFFAALRHTEAPEPSADLDITLNTMLIEDNKPLYPEPQGEPSDAQVRAALRVFFDGNPDFMSDPSNIEDMRAALRAASEAGGEGR